ncbi:hypothetical protein EUTSA_v10015214mg [Eutrema salsugineum]|uniref:Uncharacterized protein n=1 Tax=Eutrema salsugineum TaxID=72664 RepID=V4LLR4_EUTSA|nr:hypothetical protein EUTSA_v10015214mg [Eutrema salsugineum]
MISEMADMSIHRLIFVHSTMLHSLCLIQSIGLIVHGLYQKTITRRNGNTINHMPHSRRKNSHESEKKN